MEGEINHAEETDSPNQELLREITEYQRLAVTRKVQHRFLPYREISAIVCRQPAARFKVNYLFLASLVSGKPHVTCQNRLKINGPAQFCCDTEPHLCFSQLWAVSYQCRALSSPQERLATLKKQSSQIALQAQQERENFQREKNNLLVMLQKVGAVAACCHRKRCIVFTPL